MLYHFYTFPCLHRGKTVSLKITCNVFSQQLVILGACPEKNLRANTVSFCVVTQKKNTCKNALNKYKNLSKSYDAQVVI